MKIIGSITSSETWFKNKYLVKWTASKKLVEVHKGPIRPKDKPIATFTRRSPPSRNDSIKYALRALKKLD